MTAQQTPWVIISALGLTQIFAWGATYYLLAIIAEPIASDTGWPMTSVIGGLSLGLLVAGLISPRSGQAIQRYGGRTVLAASSTIIALGLTGLAVSPTLIAYFASWVVLGIGMGTGLYDAAFGTLGRLYGASARTAITALTLIAGFSSTICWPLSAILLEHLGWRTACLIYAIVHMGLSLPAHLVFVPRDPTAEIQLKRAERSHLVQRGINTSAVRALVLALTLIAIVSSIMSVYMIVFLKARGAGPAAAVGLAALLGPSQVFARLIEISFGRHYHPTWTLIFAAGLIAAGLGILLFATPILSFAVILYGAGTGIAWVARGTVPLALFGPHDYAPLMGRLALPSLIAQAISPSIGAVLFGLYGVGVTLTVLLAAALLAFAAALWLQKA